MVGAELRRQLEAAVGPDSVLWQTEDLLLFEYDAYLEVARPDLVAVPRDAAQLATVVELALQAGLPVVARGAATGLSGGAVPVRGGLVVDCNRMNRVLDVRLDDRLALVEPGLVNAELSARLAPDGFFYAPDPSSQRASTIGGNIGENAGGPHCLARGMTTNHVVGLELVALDGERFALGGPAPDPPGFDLTGVVVGSEGTLGLVASAWVRLLPLPPASLTLLAQFETLEAAGEAVSSIVARGLVPSALELIDGGTAQALEAAFAAGYPPGVEGILLVDLDGWPEQIEAEAAVVQAVCREQGARLVRTAATEQERAALWAARKGALAALARIAPNYYLHDMVVPRSRLAAVLRQVLAIADNHGIFVSNVAHAGDGNLHPTILFDLREPGIMPRVIAIGEEMLRAGVAAGGTISGEHGIGLEKQQYMNWIFTDQDLEIMRRVREAFGPGERFNPGKVFPQAEARPPRLKVWSSAAIDDETWR